MTRSQERLRLHVHEKGRALIANCRVFQEKKPWGKYVCVERPEALANTPEWRYEFMAAAFDSFLEAYKQDFGLYRDPPPKKKK